MSATGPGPIRIAAPGAIPGPRTSRLPAGWEVRLDPRVRRVDAGGALLGGDPVRLLRLRPVARRLLAGTDEVRAGDPTGAALARLLLDRGLAHPRPTLAGRVQDVTVVIPVKDRADQVRRLLSALPTALAVVIVDDGSADPAPLETLARVEQASGREVRLVRHASSRGPSAARNTGLRLVCTPVTAFLDSDVVPEADWLERLLPHLDDPAVGVVAPRIVGLPVSGGRPGWLHAYESVRSSLDLGPAEALVVPRGRVSYVPSAALVVRTAAVGDGFDERLRVAEDVDLIWRSVAAGWRCRYEPGARVAHDHRTRLGPWVRRKAYYGTGAMPLADRHGEAVAPVVLPAWAAAAWLALVAQRRWSVPAAAALTVAATVRVAAEVDRCERPLRTAATLVPLTLGAGAAQTASALTRHWWPVAAVCCLASSRAQRAVLAAGVVEGLVDWRRSGSTLDPVRHLVAHRLDDLAYGAGLWWGAWRGCSLRPLLPAISLRRCSSRPVPAAPAAVAGRRDPLPVGD